jgi:hypothetical protein
MKPVLVIVSLCFPFFLFAQKEPIKFEPGKISNGGVFGLTISPDGNTALWVESNGRRDTLIIKESQKINGVWQEPVIASFSTTTAAWKDIDPVFSPDGQQVLFQSTRPVPDRPNRTGFDIWAVKRTAKGWSAPYHLGNIINTDVSESYASITTPGHIYFMKENENKQGNSDIYVSRLVNGIYQNPENIGAPVNTIDHRESNPFIAADESFLIYFSSDPKGLGDVDLYISFNKNGTWTTPKNLGSPINSSMAEFCPFYHAKEKRLYFARQDRSGTRMKEDLYFISFDPDKFRD